MDHQDQVVYLFFNVTNLMNTKRITDNNRERCQKIFYFLFNLLINEIVYIQSTNLFNTYTTHSYKNNFYQGKHEITMT